MLCYDAVLSSLVTTCLNTFYHTYIAKKFPKKPEKIKHTKEKSQYFSNLYPTFSGFKYLPFFFSLKETDKNKQEA